jgi:hypothetical protein
MVELVRGRVWLVREKEGRSWVNRLVRRGPKREEENARMKKMERKRRMETAAVRKRRRERGDGDARVAGDCGKGGYYVEMRLDLFRELSGANCMG